MKLITKLNFIYNSNKKFLIFLMPVIIVVILIILILNAKQNHANMKLGGKSIGIINPVQCCNHIKYRKAERSQKLQRNPEGSMHLTSRFSVAQIRKIKSRKLNDLFYLPDKNDSKGSKLFINSDNKKRMAKLFQFNGLRIDPSPLSAHKKSVEPSVLFITSSYGQKFKKVALIKMDGKEYPAHSGEFLKGIYILQVSLSGIMYSVDGKIKHISVNGF